MIKLSIIFFAYVALLGAFNVPEKIEDHTLAKTKTDISFRNDLKIIR